MGISSCGDTVVAKKVKDGIVIFRRAERASHLEVRSVVFVFLRITALVHLHHHVIDV